MSMPTEDITIIPALFTNNGQKGRLYYYQGNFFQPFSLCGGYTGSVKKAIRKFLKTNKALVKSDRASPDYLNLVQLAEVSLCP